MSASKTVRVAFASLVALAMASHATPSSASDAREPNVPATHTALQKMKPVDVMHAIDTDGNGYVTREEFMKFQEELFRKIDRNGDRRLGEPEFTDQG
jgi:hypothetical protein